MGILTVRPTESEEQTIERVKAKYRISSSSKALITAAERCLTLEIQLEQLRKEKQDLQALVRNYREANSDFLRGLDALKKLNNS